MIDSIFWSSERIILHITNTKLVRGQGLGRGLIEKGVVAMPISGSSHLGGGEASMEIKRTATCV